MSYRNTKQRAAAHTRRIALLIPAYARGSQKKASEAGHKLDNVDPVVLANTVGKLTRSGRVTAEDARAVAPLTPPRLFKTRAEDRTVSATGKVDFLAKKRRAPAKRGTIETGTERIGTEKPRRSRAKKADGITTGTVSAESTKTGG